MGIEPTQLLKVTINASGGMEDPQMLKLQSSQSCKVHENMYTTDQKYRTSGLKYFVKSGFERESLMLDKHMIPRFKSLDVGSKIS